MKMNAFIITIGDEILIGQTLNTNAAYIGSKLTEIQVPVIKTSVVGDVEQAVLDEFEYAFNIADIVIVTGGLGPTHDDITRRCIVKFFDTQLVINEDVLADVKAIFEKRKKEVTKVNEDQAYVPEVAEVIRNYKGTAPGVWIEKNNKIFVSMPGVPYEMKAMMDDFVIPRLKERTKDSDRIIVMKNLLTTGIPESTLYEKLDNLSEILNGSKLAFLPSQYGVKMRITVEADDENSANDKLIEIEQLIRAKVGRYIYGKDDETLEEIVARLLTDRGLSLATAESCTGGLISNRLTNVSGSSVYFERGLVTYSNGAKVELLKVDEDLIQNFGAVSLQVCRQMAEGVRAVSGTDIGLAVTGIMGPTGASENKPVGLVFIGVCDGNICTAKEFRFGNDRILNKERASQAALDMLRRHLLGIPYDE